MKPSHPQGISAAGAPPGPRSKRRAASGNSAPARPRDARSSRRAATLAMIEQVQPTADHERNQHCAFQVHRREDHAREGSQVVIIARTAANKSAAIAGFDSQHAIRRGTGSSPAPSGNRSEGEEKRKSPAIARGALFVFFPSRRGLLLPWTSFEAARTKEGSRHHVARVERLRREARVDRS